MILKNIMEKDVDVLIDTWWNVNVEGLAEAANETAVLIDTWWNVNQAQSGSIKCLYQF